MINFSKVPSKSTLITQTYHLSWWKWLNITFELKLFLNFSTSNVFFFKLQIGYTLYTINIILIISEKLKYWTLGTVKYNTMSVVDMKMPRRIWLEINVRYS
jgi:hypothetical protein